MRIVCEMVTTPYLLDTALLTELQSIFPFLSSWSPVDVGSVYFSLAEKEHEHGLTRVWDEGNMIVEGPTEIWTSDGLAAPVQLDLSTRVNQYVEIAPLLPIGTQFILCKVVDKRPGYSKTTWRLLGKKGVSYPRAAPTTASEIATMLALECGYN